MLNSFSLRLRFTLACVLLVFGCTAAYGLVVYIEQERVEDELLLELMQREVDEYARLYHIDPTQPPPRSSQLHSYIVDPADSNGLPAELRDVPPGIHHDIVMEGRNYQVANFTLEDKRFYLTYDITLVEEREAGLVLALIVGVLSATGLAGALGWWLSRVVIAPVTRLAEAIKQLDPERPAPGFTQRFPDFEVGVIARAFDYYLKRLADFIVRERTFTEDASHELRTPIAVVNTAAERLSADSVLPAVLRPVVERMARAGRQMQATTQALLFMARESEPAAQEMEVAPLARIVEEAMDAQRHLLVGKPVELKLIRGVAAPSASAGDFKSFSMTPATDAAAVPSGFASIIVSNLLHNAISNTSAGSVELNLDGAQLVVRDSGEGIPAADLPHVFERRFRGKRNGGSEGLGLGLHIVKRICERQGWQIAVDSTPGQGATFTVVFTTKVEPA